MKIFLDTSAIYALLNQDDTFHQQAKAIFPRLQSEQVLTTNYVILETIALLSRIGKEKAITFTQIIPSIRIIWVTDQLQEKGLEKWNSNGKLSLTDCVSFVAMEQENIKDVFAFDEDFTKQGFTAFK